MLLQARKNRHFFNQTPLYEENYRRLKSLAPQLADGIPMRFDIGPRLKLRLELIERHKYTSLICLSVTIDAANPFLPDLRMTVGMYHDAHLAEVLCYQNQQRLQPDYAYPNPLMLHPDEKHQANRLLRDWLEIAGGRAVHRETVAA